MINASQNNRVDAENEAGSRALQTQVPRPSLISGHDRRTKPKGFKKWTSGQAGSDKKTGQVFRRRQS